MNKNKYMVNSNTFVMNETNPQRTLDDMRSYFDQNIVVHPILPKSYIVAYNTNKKQTIVQYLSNASGDVYNYYVTQIIALMDNAQFNPYYIENPDQIILPNTFIFMEGKNPWIRNRFFKIKTNASDEQSKNLINSNAENIDKITFLASLFTSHQGFFFYFIESSIYEINKNYQGIYSWVGHFNQGNINPELSQNNYIFREGWDSGDFYKISTVTESTIFENALNEVCNNTVNLLCNALNTKICNIAPMTSNDVYKQNDGVYSWALHYKKGKLTANNKYFFRENNDKGDFYEIQTSAEEEEFKNALKISNTALSLSDELISKKYVALFKKITMQDVYDSGAIYSYKDNYNVVLAKNDYIFKMYNSQYYYIVTDVIESEFAKLVIGCGGVVALRDKLNQNGHYYSNEGVINIYGVNNRYIGICYNQNGIFYRYMYEEWQSYWNKYYEIETTAEENIFREIAIANGDGDAIGTGNTLIQKLKDQSYINSTAIYYGYWDHSGHPDARKKVISDYNGKLFMRKGIENFSNRNYIFNEINGEREDEFKNPNNPEYLRLLEEYSHLTDTEKEIKNIEFKEIDYLKPLPKITSGCIPSILPKNLMLKMPENFNIKNLQNSNKKYNIFGTELIVDFQYVNTNGSTKSIIFTFRTRNDENLILAGPLLYPMCNDNIDCMWNNEMNILLFHGKNYQYSKIYLHSVYQSSNYIELLNNKNIYNILTDSRANYNEDSNLLVLNKISNFKNSYNAELANDYLIQPFYQYNYQEDIYNFSKKVFIVIKNINKIIVNQQDNKVIIVFNDSDRIDIYFKDIGNFRGVIKIIDRVSEKEIKFTNADINIKIPVNFTGVEKERSYNVTYSNSLVHQVPNYVLTDFGNKIKAFADAGWFDKKNNFAGDYTYSEIWESILAPKNYQGYSYIQYIDLENKGYVSMEFEAKKLKENIEIILPNYNANLNTSYKVALDHDGFILAELYRNGSELNFRSVYNSNNLNRSNENRVPILALITLILTVVSIAINIAKMVVHAVCDNDNSQTCKNIKLALNIAQFIVGVASVFAGGANVSDLIKNFKEITESAKKFISFVKILGAIASTFNTLIWSGTGLEHSAMQILSSSTTTTSLLPAMLQIVPEDIENWQTGLCDYLWERTKKLQENLQRGSMDEIIGEIKNLSKENINELSEYMVAHAYYYSGIGDIKAYRTGIADHIVEKYTLEYLENIMKYGAEYIYETSNHKLTMEKARLINYYFIKSSSVSYLKVLLDAFY